MQGNITAELCATCENGRAIESNVSMKEISPDFGLRWVSLG